MNAPPLDIILLVLLCIYLAGIVIMARWVWKQPRTPQTPQLFVEELRRVDMANVMVYAVSAPAPVDVDVVSRELTVRVNGAEQSVANYAADTTEFDNVEVPQDAEVVVRLVDVDDAGNRSEPAEISFTALDTLAPVAPGGLNVLLVAEKEISDE